MIGGNAGKSEPDIYKHDMPLQWRRPSLQAPRLSGVLKEIRDNASGLAPYDRYMLAEQLAYAADPTYKFSDYGRLWLEDRAFIDQYKSTYEPGNWHSMDRKYMLRELLKQVTDVPGDFAECGVYKGASAYWLCDARQCVVHLFDSWQGLSEPDRTKDGMHWFTGKFSATVEDVKRTLAGLWNYELHPGWIPERFDDVADREFSFVHIDVDLYEPTVESLWFFVPRMSPGGIILGDDYGFRQCPGAKLAFDEVCGDRVSSLPTGQALVIMP